MTDGAISLETKSLVKRFGGLLATDAVSLQLRAGELHAIIGPNGAGKSTLIGQLSGEIASDSGQVFMLGREVTRMNVAQRAQLGLARSYQISQVCKEFTAHENVLMAALATARRSQQDSAGWFGQVWTPLRNDKQLAQRAMAALTQVGLESRAQTSAAVLAHGEQRQLELAMALALEPSVMLLDEPLAGMSKAESETMVQLLLQLKGRYPILLVEHDMDAVFALADRISVLVYGSIIACDTPVAIRDNAQVREAYLGDGS
jgi:branched-chain amino acid transport system ATP-binding protein